MAYTKLFHKILASSIWTEDMATRLVWITLLVMKDQHHIVYGSIGGIANIARVPVEDCARAMQKFQEPDLDDSSGVENGIRIKKLDHGGWLVINGSAYRDSKDEDERRAWMASYMRQYRAKRKENVNNRKHSLTPVNPSDQIRTEQEDIPSECSSNGSSEPVQAALSLGSDVMQSRTKKTPLMTNADLKELQANPAYRGLDLIKEAFKFNQWCDTNGKQKTKRRFVNWINRIA